MERKKGKKPTVRNQPTIVHQSPQAVFLENLNLIPLPPPPSSNTNDAATVVKKNTWWSQVSCLEESAGLSRLQGGETVVQDSPPPPPPPPPSPPPPPPSPSNNNNNNNVVPIANFIFYRPEDSTGEQEYQQEYPLDLSMKKKSPVREEEIALAALKSCNYRELARHYSERLGFTINESTVRGIKKSYLYKVQKGEISPPPPPPPSSNDSSNNTETVSDLPPPPPPPPQSSATAEEEEEEEDLVESVGKQASSSTDHHHHHHHQTTVQETCEVLKKMDSLRLAPCSRLTGSQRKQLETMFLSYPYPNSSFKKDIADRLQLTENQVTDWYSGKRKRVRGQKDFSVILPTHHLSPPPPPPPSAEDTVHLTANKRYPPHRYTQDQVDCLISAFHTQTHPNIICRSELASKTGLRLSQVTDWFQNRRRKEGVKNTSIFSLWVNEERAKIEKTNPELPDYVVSTILESYWKSMTSEEKRAYSEKESTKEFVTLQEEERQHQLFFAQTRLNVEQTTVLESTFVHTLYPDSITVEKLAGKIGEAPIRVRNWFKRRRARERAQSV